MTTYYNNHDYACQTMEGRDRGAGKGGGPPRGGGTTLRPQHMQCQPGPAPGPGPGPVPRLQNIHQLHQQLQLQQQMSFQHQHYQQLQQQQQQHQQQQHQGPHVCYSTATLPASMAKSRARFMNLRDSVKKSPTKSTAKVTGPGGARLDHPWGKLSFDQVRESA